MESLSETMSIYVSTPVWIFKRAVVSLGSTWEPIVSFCVAAMMHAWFFLPFRFDVFLKCSHIFLRFFFLSFFLNMEGTGKKVPFIPTIVVHICHQQRAAAMHKLCENVDFIFYSLLTIAPLISFKSQHFQAHLYTSPVHSHSICMEP